MHFHKWHYLRWNLRICVKCHEVQKYDKASYTGRLDWVHYWVCDWFFSKSKEDYKLIAQWLNGSPDYGFDKEPKEPPTPQPRKQNNRRKKK